MPHLIVSFYMHTIDMINAPTPTVFSILKLKRMLMIHTRALLKKDLFS